MEAASGGDALVRSVGGDSRHLRASRVHLRASGRAARSEWPSWQDQIWPPPLACRAPWSQAAPKTPRLPRLATMQVALWRQYFGPQLLLLTYEQLLESPAEGLAAVGEIEELPTRGARTLDL